MEFDALTAGVKPGGLRSKQDIKLLICYLLSSIPQGLSKTDLINVLQDNNLANYFEVASAFDELLKQGNLTEEMCIRDSHIAHYGLLALIQLPVVGTHLAGDHFEQSGFPGAVYSHHPYFVVCLYLKGHALKQEVRAESLCQIADAQKSHLYLPFPDIMPLILLIDRFSYRYLL